MPLTSKQKDMIILMDTKAKQILQQDDKAALLMSLARFMQEVKDIIDGASRAELKAYCRRYRGFHQYMKLLENLAIASSKGLLDEFIT